ncbi:MAG: hypothetical protein GC150_13375 [Rhizobiales bacterium]|nr:hypothetical protein [Hyphomicrobiales bacterium]
MPNLTRRETLVGTVQCLLAGVFALGLGTLTASAHHTFVAKYDAAKVVTLKGSVTSVRWQNPHVFFVIDVGGTAWTVEAEGIPKIEAKGLTRALLSEGAAVEVKGWPARDGGAEVGLKSIRVKGRTITIRNTAR